jgi:hypothetical protein
MRMLFYIRGSRDSSDECVTNLVINFETSLLHCYCFGANFCHDSLYNQSQSVYTSRFGLYNAIFETRF